jgi:hypothetical protein
MGPAAVIRNAGVNEHCPWRFLPLVMACLLAIAPGVLSSVQACGLEPTYKGGLMVSYPGALDVAVAVADSRRSGLLPPADPGAVSSEVLMQQMLADLRRLESRLDAGLPGNEEDSATAFSLVLVGPGLWSHYHPTPDGIRAEYHTDGPLSGHTVVLTHHAVLRALLKGNLSAEQALELGLLAYSGSDTAPIQSTFDTGFRSSS